MNEKGSVFGGMLLVVGCCVGAGMLGLPIVTGLAGFFPSLFMLIAAWAFMTLTGLLLVEVNGWFPERVNLLTMTENTLGKIGKAVCWITYLFLFYAVLVGYISGIGGLFTTFFQSAFSLRVPEWIGSLFFVLLFGWIVYSGTRRVDLCNRGLMVGKIGAFILLLCFGVSFMKPTLLLHFDPKYTFISLPLLIISFGFHNIVPSLVDYLKGDIKKVRFTIICGSLLTLALYLVWEVFVLALIPVVGENGLEMSLKHDREASQALTTVVGSSWISVFAQALAFFAILTSFISIALSLVHFLADGLKISYKRQENGYLCSLALAPPLCVSLFYPKLFFKALNFAGGICTVILFGILPVLMVFVGRRRRKESGYLVAGGKWTLSYALFFALFVLVLQLCNLF